MSPNEQMEMHSNLMTTTLFDYFGNIGDVIRYDTIVCI